MAAVSWIINKIRNRKKEEVHQAEGIIRYELDVVEVQSSIITDLTEVNIRLMEELGQYRAIEEEDNHLLTIMKDIKEGKADLENMLST